MKVPELGVEEEFLLVDAETGTPAPRIARVIPDARRLAGEYVEPELHRAQIETASRPCSSLMELSEDLTQQRNAVAEAARNEGALVVASGTYPGRMGESGRLITDKERYETMAEVNPLIAREQLICGCHVHVSVEEDQDRIRVVNRIRRYLHCLLALSANSPFWEGQDSGFASFRTEVWSRWPSAGSPGAFEHPRQYWELVQKLISAGIILDEGMVYWDVRLSSRYPTVEVRIADVGLTVEDSVTIGGLARALVMDCLGATGPSIDLRPELLRAASWSAARFGVTGDLLDPGDGTTATASNYFSQLLTQLTLVLSDSGDGDLIEQGVNRILSLGTGADRQRAVSAGGQDLVAAVKLAAIES